MKRLFLILLIGTLSISLFSQQTQKVDSIYNAQEIRRISDFGFGFGLDYGGLIGIKLTICPIDHLALFGAGGYQPAGYGWNLGAAINLHAKTNKHAVRPYLKFMYGVNASTYIEGAPEYTKTFLGPSVGIGTELRFGKFKSHGLNFDINVPIRDDSFDDMMDEIEADPRVEIEAKPGPITISFGYHFEF